MHNRMPSRRRQGAPKGKEPVGQGGTLPARGDAHERSPRVPHERDESSDSQGADEPSAPRMAQTAAEDIERGLVDTDKAPVLEETYDKVRAGTHDPLKKFSP